MSRNKDKIVYYMVLNKSGNKFTEIRLGKLVIKLKTHFIDYNPHPQMITLMLMILLRSAHLHLYS